MPSKKIKLEITDTNLDLDALSEENVSGYHLDILESAAGTLGTVDGGEGKDRISSKDL